MQGERGVEKTKRASLRVWHHLKVMGLIGAAAREYSTQTRGDLDIGLGLEDLHKIREEGGEVAGFRRNWGDRAEEMERILDRVSVQQSSYDAMLVLSINQKNLQTIDSPSLPKPIVALHH